jgi:ankyrin repeat protein
MSSDPHRANLRQMSRFTGGYREHYYAAEEAASTHILHMLASLGHLEIFKQALTLHKDKINLQTALVGHTPIITAAAAGHVEVTRYLLQQGADPLIPNWYGNALHCAAEANEAPAIALLLEAGMNPDTRTANGVTPLA